MDVRVCVLVDGFNVYHSLCDAGRARGGRRGMKWLNLWSLSRALIPQIPGNAIVGSVHYFTALAEHLVHRNPGVVARHRTYIEALRSTGVNVVLGRFKRVFARCGVCSSQTTRWEEKETDVAISVKLLEALHRDEAEAILLISGDTDLVPAVKLARSLYPSRFIACAFPYGRKNKELANVASLSMRISRKAYVGNQLPDPVVLPGGKLLSKPPRW